MKAHKKHYRVVDTLGRVVIPHDIRQAKGLLPGKDVKCTETDTGVQISPTDRVCALCNRAAEISINNRGVCPRCVKFIKDL